MENTELNSANKKRLLLFIAIAYGVSFLMMIPMYIGKQKGMDLTQIVDAQMCSPAAGVALGYLVFCKGEKRVPKMFMTVLVVNYIIQLVLGLLSIFANPFGPEDVFDFSLLPGLAESMDASTMETLQAAMPLHQIYYFIGQYALMIFSVLLWIGYFVARRERRRFCGLCRNNEGKGILLVLLFVGLYIVRIFAPALLDGVFNNSLSDYLAEYEDGFKELFKNPTFYALLVSLPFNYPMVIIAFFGEEYGWRYFLQPVMQKKFGMKLGVILLGIVWGLWHLPVDTMFYTEDSVPQMIAGQIITCVFMGIFMGYAYLKTNNIWIPVCIHFLNNNLVVVFSGTASDSVLQDQHVTWLQLLEIAIVCVVVFGLFIFTKEYKEKKVKEALDA